VVQAALPVQVVLVNEADCLLVCQLQDPLC
jgi:hypothetical protein